MEGPASTSHRWFERSLWLWLSLVAVLAGGTIIALLYPIPFGPIFNSSLFLLMAGLLGLLFFSGACLLSAAVLWKKAIGAVLLLFLVAVGSLTLLFAIDHRILYFRGPPPEMTAEKWREDLHYLASQMAEHHPGIFSRVSEEAFWGAVEELEDRLSNLTENQITMELFRILALPQDAHSFPMIIYPSFDLHLLPLRTYFFDDGLYIIETGREHRALVGSRILKIGDLTIEEVLERSTQFLAGGNDLSSRERFSIIGMITEWLESEGIIEKVGRARLTLEKESGKHEIVTLEPVRAVPWIYWFIFHRVDDSLPHPISARRQTNFWFELDEKTGTIYFQYNAVVASSGEESITEFAERLTEFARTHEFERLIVDIRTNGGGGGGECLDLVKALRDSPEINRHGKLFVLTAKQTYSAAVIFASMLQNSTKAVMIGEPTGQGPAFYGGPNLVQLPNSKLAFFVSTRLNQTSFAEDKRDRITPDLEVGYTYEDFAGGRDPQVEAVLQYPRESRAPAAPMDSLMGRYLFDPGLMLIVEERADRLAFTITDFIETSYRFFQSDLYPISDTEYGTDIDSAQLGFELDGDGRAQSAMFVWGEVLRTAHRVADDFRMPMELVAAGEVDEGIRRFLEVAEEERRSHDGLETALNLLGYRYLGSEQYEESVKVFNLNVQLFPESFNVYDSLGEAYMEQGDNELAIRNYEKSLELNPANSNAKSKLKTLSANGGHTPGAEANADAS